jgi:hypothetical protein
VSDLLDLQERGLLNGQKIGKTWHFRPISNLEDHLREIA